LVQCSLAWFTKLLTPCNKGILGEYFSGLSLFYRFWYCQLPHINCPFILYWMLFCLGCYTSLHVRTNPTNNNTLMHFPSPCMHVYHVKCCYSSGGSNEFHYLWKYYQIGENENKEKRKEEWFIKEKSHLWSKPNSHQN